MRLSLQFRFILAGMLWLLGFALQSQAQTGFPPCREDGSMPDGYHQCDCQKTLTYRGEYTDLEHEFRVQLPDEVVAFGSGCGHEHDGFDIDLKRPNSGDGGDRWNAIRVAAGRHRREPFEKMIDSWKQSWNTDDKKEDIEKGRITALQFGQPEQTSLGSLPALRLKATWTEADQGKLISDQIFAYNPEGTIVYEIAMICPANRYEKNLKLFNALIESFRYGRGRQRGLAQPFIAPPTERVPDPFPRSLRKRVGAIFPIWEPGLADLPLSC